MRQSARGGGFASQQNTLTAGVTKGGSSSRHNVLASLRATQIVDSKPVLPAELIAVILDYVPAADLISCARVSRRIKEMVYDDTRWIQKLRIMGLWNEAEARQKQDEALQRRMSQKPGRTLDDTGWNGSRPDGAKEDNTDSRQGRTGSTTPFDAAVDDDSGRSPDRPPRHQKRGSEADGFDELVLSPSKQTKSVTPAGAARALTAISQVRSVRGLARQEFGKIYAALNPFYVDLSRSSGFPDLVFQVYQDQQKQAQILADVTVFARSDVAFDCQQRTRLVQSRLDVFEEARLEEFRSAYQANNVEKMHRLAQVLMTLNGGASMVDTFIQQHPLIQRTRRLADPLDCVEGVSHGHIDLGPSQRFFEGLVGIFSDASTLIDQVFPPSIDVLFPFFTRITHDIIQEAINSVLDAARQKTRETYLKAVAGIFEQAMRFAISIQPTQTSQSGFKEQCHNALVGCFESHIDTYLNEEFEFFKAKSVEEVVRWEDSLSEQEAQAESFFMSNINRQAVKNDFLTSFRKVIMMPVNVLPAFPSKGNATTQLALEESEKRPASPSPSTVSLGGSTRSTTAAAEAPKTELAAKAAIMNSRLEGIKSLFSIEVALNMVHYAKSSIERALVFVRTDDQHSQKAKAQCEVIFIALLQILGQQHIKTGFDKAVNHLGNYNPRQISDARSKSRASPSEAQSVEPLVTFLELVNVGDLIQQMVDVFYAQELVSPKLIDVDDFLNPSGKAKKHFEQMLDERVAAGMSKGIDVLIAEVEYICATTQEASDFNPVDSKGRAAGVVDIGPSITAKQVVSTLESHTGMLVGTTDKNMLDVFNQEVGLRLFGVLCKHIKRQRISIDGAIKLISDINLYASFTSTLRQKSLTPYFSALRELSQIYLIDCSPSSSSTSTDKSSNKTNNNTKNARAKELATIIADTDRYRGIFGAEEVYEFAERRADWYAVRKDVERAMYGIGCVVM